jgi:hypothetical protein
LYPALHLIYKYSSALQGYYDINATKNGGSLPEILVSKCQSILPPAMTDLLKIHPLSTAFGQITSEDAHDRLNGPKTNPCNQNAKL